MAKRMTATAAPRGTEDDETRNVGFDRVVAIAVGLENYRKPQSGEALPTVDYAHADAQAFAATVAEIFQDMPAGSVEIATVLDQDASLVALRDEIGFAIKGLGRRDLFIFYYAGHGFHGAGGNRLSAFDTNRANVDGTSFRLQDDLLERLAQSECRQALVFVDACAEKFRDLVRSRDVIGNLDPTEVEDFLDDGWYCGVFLSCSPGEKSYPSPKLGHGVWTHFLLEALSGQADDALTRDRWLTDAGLRDHLRQCVPRYLTRELSVKGIQTPQAIISASNTFRIRHVARPPEVSADAALAGIALRNDSEFLEGEEVGAIRQLAGFERGFHTVPSKISASADAWCRRLLADQVGEELQEKYQDAIDALGARRKDVRKEADDGATLDTPFFRFWIETGQNPDDPAGYYIRRHLELRQGWQERREAIDGLFAAAFDRLVIECERIDEDFDELVDKLEDVAEEQGGELADDDRTRRVTYSRDGAAFTFDLKRRRVEITFHKKGALSLIDAAQQFQLGLGRSSAILPPPPRLVEPDATAPRGRPAGKERCTRPQGGRRRPREAGPGARPASGGLIP